MTRQVKISVAIAGVFVLVVAGLLAFTATRDTPEKSTSAKGAEDSRLVRADSHVLGEKADTGVTFVEFLDFECEACRAVYPAVEQLRKEYAGKVTFVVRHFPLSGHRNAERAARTAEAAGRQGKFEEMYHHLYETQPDWGEKDVPLDRVFRVFAADLGLDIDQFDKDYADPSTAARVEKDRADGVALGVSGTPTFFLNGERIEPRDYTDLTDALDAALAG